MKAAGDSPAAFFSRGDAEIAETLLRVLRDSA
jgi:hypothetical protein